MQGHHEDTSFTCAVPMVGDMGLRRLLTRLSSSTCTWTAHAVAYERVVDEGYEMLALGETPDGEGRVLMVQRGLEFDEQDIDSGEDTYCLVDGDGRVRYGGVRSWSASADALVLDLDDEAAAV